MRFTEEQLREYQTKTRNFGKLSCETCGEVVPKNGPGQRYCGACSEKRDLERKRLWARDNRKDFDPAAYERERSAMLDRGAKISEAARGSIQSSYRQPDLKWLVRVAVPFTYAASKNHIYTTRATGHVALRKEGLALRQQITWELYEALRRSAVKVAHNKVWVDIFVQKPDHKGDAINVVDLVCDAVKDALKIDDRWFSIRCVDWQITKSEPLMFIGVGQEDVEDCQACSSCGRVLPFLSFGRNSSNKRGLNRNCVECSRVG